MIIKVDQRMGKVHIDFTIDELRSLASIADNDGAGLNKDMQGVCQKVLKYINKRLKYL